MMSKEILLVADAVSNEKGVSRDVIFEAIESALATATKKFYEDEEMNCRVRVDRKTGEYETFRVWTVVEDEEFTGKGSQLTLEQAKEKSADLNIGDDWEERIDNIEFGRIAAQTAKQVIVQKVREAERDIVIAEYIDKIGTLISGTVKKVTRESVLVDLGGNAEGLLTREHMIPRENFRVGDEGPGSVDLEGRAATVGLSRAAMLEVLRRRRKLSPAQFVWCCVRYFCDGGALGSRAFVEGIFEARRERFGTGVVRVRAGFELLRLPDLRWRVWG